jgi:hypothetical protein
MPAKYSKLIIVEIGAMRNEKNPFLGHRKAPNSARSPNFARFTFGGGFSILFKEQ